MIGKNNNYLSEIKRGIKKETYSIKKFKVGAVSIVIGASIFFGVGSVAQASERVSNNKVIDNTITTGKIPEAPKEFSKLVEKNTKESDVSKVGIKVDKDILKASITTLEEKLKLVQDSEGIAIATAHEVLATAKSVLANEAARQTEVDEQVQIVQALSTVVTEAKTRAFDKKLEEKKVEGQKEKEEVTNEGKAVDVAKAELTQVASEAEVTNAFAKAELNKNRLKTEIKPAIQKTIEKSEEALGFAKELLGNTKATKEQIAKSLAELKNAIKAVYTELENAGAKRNGRFEVNLAENTEEALIDASTERGEKWLKDHGYTSLADIPIKTKERNSEEIKKLNSQIQWLDFGDKKAWTKLKANGQLQVGSVYEKELIPGYTVKFTVKELNHLILLMCIKDVLLVLLMKVAISLTERIGWICIQGNPQ